MNRQEHEKMDNLILDEEAKEGEKEREAAENRKREREGHFKNLFKGHMKRTKTGVAKYINLEPLKTLPMTSSQLKKIGNASDLKYQNYIKLSNEGAKIHPPSLEQERNVDELQRKIDELKTMDPEPMNYIKQMKELRKELDSIGPALKEQKIQFADAVDCFHNAVYCRQRSKELDQLDDLEAWDKVLDALILLGVRDSIDNIRKAEIERQKIEKERKKQAELEAKQTAAIIAAQRAAQEAENNNHNDESTEINILDSNGVYVPVGSLLDTGLKHARQRGIKLKKRTKRDG